MDAEKNARRFSAPMIGSAKKTAMHDGGGELDENGIGELLSSLQDMDDMDDGLFGGMGLKKKPGVQALSASNLER
ncbi:hypothetical protein HDU67_001473, partial [Dinochytrium kinnereticum]